MSYAIYDGDLGNVASHTKKDRTDDGGDRIEEIAPRAGNAYCLLVALTASAEGSYGRFSIGAERPVPALVDRCLAAQSLTSCSP